jgi:hypothetical protein
MQGQDAWHFHDNSSLTDSGTFAANLPQMPSYGSCGAHIASCHRKHQPDPPHKPVLGYSKETRILFDPAFRATCIVTRAPARILQPQQPDVHSCICCLLSPKHIIYTCKTNSTIKMLPTVSKAVSVLSSRRSSVRPATKIQ